MTSRGTHRSRSRVHLDLTVVLALAILGQTLLVLIGEVAPDLVRFAGVGPKIAPDAKGYLTAAEMLPGIEDEWSGKILYVSLLRLGLALGFAEWFAVPVQFLLAVGAGVALVDARAQDRSPVRWSDRSRGLTPQPAGHAMDLSVDDGQCVHVDDVAHAMGLPSGDPQSIALGASVGLCSPRGTAPPERHPGHRIGRGPLGLGARCQSETD